MSLLLAVVPPFITKSPGLPTHKLPEEAAETGCCIFFVVFFVSDADPQTQPSLDLPVDAELVRGE